MAKKKKVSWFELVQRDVKAAQRCDKSEDLTESQKISIAFLAGVPIELHPDRLRTRVPVGYEKVNGKWTVFALSETKGD